MIERNILFSVNMTKLCAADKREMVFWHGYTKEGEIFCILWKLGSLFTVVTLKEENVER